MNTPRIVAIVLHFRTPRLTLSCLESLLSSGVLEVMLVDNSQDDGRTIAAMEQELAAMRGGGGVVKVLAPSRNLGFAGGINLALDALLSSGPARVLLLNSDALMTREALHALNEAIDHGAELAGPRVGGEALVPETMGMPGYHRWLGLLVPARAPGAVGYLSGACLMISERVATHGLLDERFFFYGEDIELSQRLRAAGAPIDFVARARVLHLPSSSARNGSPFYEYHVLRGHLLLARSLTRGPAGHGMALAGRLLVLPVRALIRALRARSVVPLVALVQVAYDFVLGRVRDLTPPPDGGQGCSGNQ